ncbi:sugar-binding transcriptional regulator [Pseudoroseicyclus aestuarii]|uniref:DNA-binding transcriptional regulator LsrR (DeoR family) n=1 Tax=Pseudoroseicyclus aestuarii TaxID=1795041 RepID=A0A318SSN6_9RHOB|nr:sugar-binding transcriptional regulator [Pseudoroseicyclus aestuarii]PYE84840.1 DNA-binding transcriptional regulator LsrR (DeoR family) [Pseudoroseicyclus aestuarii]
MSPTAVPQQPDDSLAIRAAWLHYAGGLTQAQVAQRLGVSSVKAHRLVARANQSGAVKVRIDGAVAECAALEARLSEIFALAQVEVVPDLSEEGLPLRALGTAGAAFLQREIGAGGAGPIGVGHGRTLSAAIRALPRLAAPEARFVSLMGGLTRNYAANPHDVMHRLAEKTGAEAHVIPVPFFANSPADRDVLLAQRGVAEVMRMAAEAPLMVVGIGTAQPDAQLVASRMIDLEEIAEVRRLGGVGEVLGHFFDEAGRVVDSALSARTVSPPVGSLGGRRLVAIAGGIEKLRGIRSVLRSGLVTGLIIDERTAQALAEDHAG